MLAGTATVEEASDSRDEARRRKLRPGEPRRFTPGQESQRSRRLSETVSNSSGVSAEEEAAIAAEIAAESDIWASVGVKFMTVSDFSGIFLLWAFATVGMLTFSLLVYTQQKRVGKATNVVKEMTRRPGGRKARSKAPNLALEDSEDRPSARVVV